MIDLRFLDLAIRIGDRGLGRTGANPSVGCVLVRDHRIIGLGHTADGGRPHAERIALEQSTDAKNADAYVTLEPCAHHGKTSPCANALIEARISRLICPLEDPDPRVAGTGFQMIRDAGIEVIHPKISEIPAGLRPFLLTKSLGRSMITLKSATTLDGKIALSNRQSQWITNDSARKTTRAMRAQFDAIIIGVGTLIADDPSLNIRAIGIEKYHPRPVILDTNCRTSIKAKIFKTSRPIIFHGEDVMPSSELSQKADCIGVKLEGSSVSIHSVAQKLAELGLNSALIEGGSMIAASALKAGIVDQIIHVGAGKFIGDEGLSAVGDLDIETMKNVPKFALKHTSQIGDDILSLYENPNINVADFFPE